MIVGALLAGAMRRLPARGYYRNFMGTQIGVPDERGGRYRHKNDQIPGLVTWALRAHSKPTDLEATLND